MAVEVSRLEGLEAAGLAVIPATRESQVLQTVEAAAAVALGNRCNATEAPVAVVR